MSRVTPYDNTHNLQQTHETDEHDNTRKNRDTPLRFRAGYGIIFAFSTSRGQSLPGNVNLRESPNDFPLNKGLRTRTQL